MKKHKTKQGSGFHKCQESSYFWWEDKRYEGGSEGAGNILFLVIIGNVLYTNVLSCTFICYAIFCIHVVFFFFFLPVAGGSF